MRPWPFRRLLFVQGVLIAVAPLLIVTLVGWRLVVPQIDEAVERHQQALTRAAVVQVETHLASARRELLSVAALIEAAPRSRAPAAAEGSDELDRLLDTVVGRGALYEAIYLAGRDAVVTSLGLPAGRRTARPDLRGVDLSRREFVARAMRTGEQVWSSSFLSAVSGRQAIAVALPVPRGVLVAELALGQFSNFLRELPVDANALTLLVDRRGYVIAHPRPDLAGQQLSLSDQPLVGDAFARGESSGRLHHDGREMIGAALAIPGVHWVALVAQPVAAAFGVLDTVTLAMLAGLAAAIGLSLLGAYALAGGSARRLAAFARNAGALADGRYDLAWPSTRIAEFIRLSDDLRRMADAIRTREQALKGSEARYREVVENSADLVTRVDAEGRFRFVNRTAARVFGVPAEACVGRLAFDFVHPDDRLATQDAFARWRTSDADATRFESRLVGADGKVFNIVWSIHAHRDAGGAIVELSGIGHDMTEYRRADAEIRRLALVASATSNAVLVTDDAGRVEWVNAACEQLTGRPLAELRGAGPWEGRVAAAAHADLLKWMEREMRQGRGFSDVELQVRQADGRAGWHAVEVQPVRDGRGRLTQFVVIESDITARRAAQDALRASEERLRATLENTPNVAVQWYDEDGRVVLWNPSSEHLYGVPAARALGRTLAELAVFSDDETTAFKAMLARIAYTGEAIGPYESRFRRADGAPGWLLCTTFGIPDQAGSHRFVCMGIDVSQQKALLQALQASERKFLAVFHSSPVPIVLSRFEAQVTVSDCNAAWERQFGYRREAIVGLGGDQFGFWEDPAQRAALMDELRAIGAVENHEAAVRRADGRVMVCLLSGRVVQLESERIAIMAYRDVTEERRIAQQLRELNASLEDRVAQRTSALAAANDELRTTLDTLQRAQDELIRAEKLAALGALVAGIAHELNTPIGNGLMAATTLDDHAREFDRAIDGGALRRSTLDRFVHDARTATDIVVRNLHKASELVNSFKQVAVDQTSAQRRKFALEELVSEIVLTMRPSFKKTPYVVDYAVPGDLMLDSYPGPLGQILSNLINNALRHGFEGRDRGTVRIAAAPLDERRVRIVVDDDGGGIAAEHLPRIFDPFFTTKLGQGGSGLGLHIVHQLVTRVLGGEIRVDSSRAGTRFTIEIPTHAPEPPR